MEDFPRAHYADALPGSLKRRQRSHLGRRFHGSNHLHVDVQRHRLKPEGKSNRKKVKTYAKRFSQGHRSFFVPGSEEKWYATLAHKPDGLWNKVAEEILIIERASCIQRNECLVQRTSEKQRWWKKNIDTLQRRNLRLESCYYASLSPSISSVFTEP